MKRSLLAFAMVLMAVAVTTAQTEIRKVDFRNFTYEVDSLGDGDKVRVTVKDGNYSRMEEEDRYYFAVMEVAYGDLNGDGSEEAAVSYVVNTGGTGNFTNGLVFSMKAGKPVVIATFEGGDRAYGGIQGVWIDKGQLVVERNAPGPNGGACCAEFIDTSRYRLVGGEFREVGKPTRRELYPSTRVRFKRGETMSIFSVSLPKYEKKRYVIGARRGQKLLVSSGISPASHVSYQLISGDGDVEEGTNGIIVTLKENGDYIFELSNTTDREIQFSVTVQID